MSDDYSLLMGVRIAQASETPDVIASNGTRLIGVSFKVNGFASQQFVLEWAKANKIVDALTLEYIRDNMLFYQLHLPFKG